MLHLGRPPPLAMLFAQDFQRRHWEEQQLVGVPWVVSTLDCAKVEGCPVRMMCSLMSYNPLNRRALLQGSTRRLEAQTEADPCRPYVAPSLHNSPVRYSRCRAHCSNWRTRWRVIPDA